MRQSATSELNFENSSQSNSAEINYASVIENMIQILKSRFENCPDFKLQTRWETRIQKMIGILD